MMLFNPYYIDINGNSDALVGFTNPTPVKSNYMFSDIIKIAFAEQNILSQKSDFQNNMISNTTLSSDNSIQTSDKVGYPQSITTEQSEYFGKKITKVNNETVMLFMNSIKTSTPVSEIIASSKDVKALLQTLLSKNSDNVNFAKITKKEHASIMKKLSANLNELCNDKNSSMVLAFNKGDINPEVYTMDVQLDDTDITEISKIFKSLQDSTTEQGTENIILMLTAAKNISEISKDKLDNTVEDNANKSTNAKINTDPKFVIKLYVNNQLLENANVDTGSSKANDVGSNTEAVSQSQKTAPKEVGTKSGNSPSDADNNNPVATVSAKSDSIHKLNFNSVDALLNDQNLQENLELKSANSKTPLNNVTGAESGDNQNNKNTGTSMANLGETELLAKDKNELKNYKVPKNASSTELENKLQMAKRTLEDLKSVVYDPPKDDVKKPNLITEQELGSRNIEKKIEMNNSKNQFVKVESSDADTPSVNLKIKNKFSEVKSAESQNSANVEKASTGNINMHTEEKVKIDAEPKNVIDNQPSDTHKITSQKEVNNTTIHAQTELSEKLNSKDVNRIKDIPSNKENAKHVANLDNLQSNHEAKYSEDKTKHEQNHSDSQNLQSKTQTNEKVENKRPEVNSILQGKEETEPELKSEIKDSGKSNNQAFNSVLDNVAKKHSTPSHEIDDRVSTVNSSRVNNGSVKNVTSFREVPLSYTKVEVGQLIEEVAKYIKEGNKRTLKLEIEPENLGQLKLSIDSHKNTVNAKIEVESAKILQLINNNSEILKHEIQQSGIHLNSLQVTVNGQEGKSGNSSKSRKRNHGFKETKDAAENIEDSFIPKDLGYNTYDYLI